MAHPSRPLHLTSTAPLRVVVWPDYSSPQEVIHPLVELSRLLQSGAVFLFFHDDALEASEIRRRVVGARERTSTSLPIDCLAFGNARTDSVAFDAMLEIGSAKPSRVELSEHLRLKVVMNRYHVEEMCVERGVVARSIERSFCTKPWRQLHIEASGVATPCCLVWPGQERTPSLLEHTLPEVYNSENMRRVRLNMLKGIRDEVCTDCWDTEDRGEHSFRALPDCLDEELAITRAMTQEDGAIPAEKIAPLDIDIRWSNLCNFKCRMCSHTYSSAWFDDVVQIAEKRDRQLGLPPEESTRRWWVFGEKAVISLNSHGRALEKLAPYLGSVSSVYSAGGEPLMMEEHFALLEHLLPRASQIKLTYNTNLSRLDYRGRDLLAIWEPFQHVSLAVSVDGFGEVGEYVRTGFQTDRFLENLHKLREGARRNPRLVYHLAITVSNYNLFHIPEFIRGLLKDDLVDGVDQIYLAWVRAPLHASPFVMPRALREQAASRYEEVLAAIPLEGGPHALGPRLNVFARSLRSAEDGLFPLHRDEVWTMLEQLDALRGTSWRKVAPHMGCFEPSLLSKADPRPNRPVEARETGLAVGCESHQREIERLSADCAALTHQLAVEREKREAILSSRSWRWSSPARLAGEFLRLKLRPGRDPD
jgi:hypothetical protein